MAFPEGVLAIDLMMGTRAGDDAKKQYDFIRKQLKDSSTDDNFPVQYMFKDVPYSDQSRSFGREAGAPEELKGAALILDAMDRCGVERAQIGVEDEVGQQMLEDFPDRFFGQVSFDANDVMGGVRKIVRAYETWGIKSVGVFNAGMFPQVDLDDKKMYPCYAKCVELDLPVMVCVGVPGPRVRFSCQHVERIDEVMYDFPDLKFIMRHGAEPWTDLAVKLMVKWPNLYYSTSAFAPKHYPKAIIDYANSRGSDKIMYAGYFPMGLSLDRIFNEMRNVPFKDVVWPKFLRENAIRVLKL